MNTRSRRFNYDEEESSLFTLQGWTSQPKWVLGLVFVSICCFCALLVSRIFTYEETQISLFQPHVITTPMFDDTCDLYRHEVELTRFEFSHLSPYDTKNSSLVYEFFYCGCGDIQNEAVNLVLNLYESDVFGRLAIKANSQCFCPSYSQEVLNTLEYLRLQPYDKWPIDFFIRHANPVDARLTFPYMRYNDTTLTTRPKFTILRTSSDVSRIDFGVTSYISSHYNFVWVPSTHIADVLVTSGLPRSIISVIPFNIDPTIGSLTPLASSKLDILTSSDTLVNNREKTVINDHDHIGDDNDVSKNNESHMKLEKKKKNHTKSKNSKKLNNSETPKTSSIELVNPDVIPKLPRVLLNAKKDDFVFLSVLKWSRRDSAKQLVRAFLETFTKKDKVKLILLSYFDETPLFSENSQDDEENNLNLFKKHQARYKHQKPLTNTPLDSISSSSSEQYYYSISQKGKEYIYNKKFVENDIKSIISALNTKNTRNSKNAKKPKNTQVSGNPANSDISHDFASFSQFHVISEPLNKADLKSLLASVDTFVLPSRGLGWNSLLINAMSQGLPVITTDYKGVSSFINETNSFPIKYSQLVKPAIGHGVGVGHGVGLDIETSTINREAKWALPSMSSLKHQLKHVFTLPVEERKKIGYLGQNTVLEQFSPEVVNKKIKDFCGLELQKKRHHGFVSDIIHFEYKSERERAQLFDLLPESDEHENIVKSTTSERLSKHKLTIDNRSYFDAVTTMKSKRAYFQHNDNQWSRVYPNWSSFDPLDNNSCVSGIFTNAQVELPYNSPDSENAENTNNSEKHEDLENPNLSAHDIYLKGRVKSSIVPMRSWVSKETKQLLKNVV